MDKFRFQVHRQHGGTGFPMGTLYATNDRDEAVSVAKSLIAMETGSVYFSISDLTKPHLNDPDSFTVKTPPQGSFQK